MPISSDEADRLVRNFEAASANIKKQAGGKPGESNEKAYGIAYQQLVKNDLKPQIRKKYR